MPAAPQLRKVYLQSVLYQSLSDGIECLLYFVLISLD